MTRPTRPPSDVQLQRKREANRVEARKRVERIEVLAPELGVSQFLYHYESVVVSGPALIEILSELPTGEGDQRLTGQVRRLCKRLRVRGVLEDWPPLRPLVEQLEAMSAEVAPAKEGE